MKWYRKAAEQNYALAQYDLGVFYAKGEGVAKDDAEAYKWFLLAAAQGFEESKRLAATIEKYISRGEIADGQKLARELQAAARYHLKESRSSGTGLAQTRPTSSGSWVLHYRRWVSHHE